MTRKPLNSILVKPAGPSCNLACTYCFYTDKEALFPATKPHRMSEETLTEMIRQLMGQSGEHVGIGWQGGEPTLMGLPFFEKAVALMQKFGRDQSIANGLQTNGLFLDRAWARFLQHFNFLVGLSLDGPCHIHDRYRQTGDGSGTWATVTDRAKMLLDAGVAVNALAVVTNYAADFPEETYTFLKETGLFHMQFIPCVEFAPDRPEGVQSFTVPPEKFGSFLCTLFDLWISDFIDGQPTTSIRFFDSIFYRYVGLTPPECTLQERCGDYLVVEHTGDVYACDFFVEPEWHLGNLHETQLPELLNSEKQQQFGAMKTNLPEACRSCQWQSFCCGGCSRHRRPPESPEAPGYLCEAYRRFFEHADSRLKILASAWKSGQG